MSRSAFSPILTHGYLLLAALALAACKGSDGSPGGVADAGTDASQADASHDSGHQNHDASTPDGSMACSNCVGEDAALPCTGCSIAGVCHPDGALNPENECEECAPELANTTWQARQGTSCGVGTECLPSGVCTAEALCQRAPAPVTTACGLGGTTCQPEHCDGSGSCVGTPAAEHTSCGTPSANACDLGESCDGLGACVDRGVLASGQTCGGTGTCDGSTSAPTCECPDGYRFDGTLCVDIDECAVNLHDCDRAPAACHNEPAGFSCACPDEFTGNGVGPKGCSCARDDYSPLCKPWSTVAAGTSEYHNCAISDGALFCWGNNDHGELGVGNRVSRVAPARVDDASDWTHVSVSLFGSCGVRGGGMYCWGNLARSGGSLTPERVGSNSDWTSVITSGSSFCGLRNGGQIHCGWPGADVHAIVETAGFDTLVGDSTRACALRDGTLWCWGGNGFGGQPQQVGSFTDWVNVDAGGEKVCGVRANGEVYCGAGYSVPFTLTLVPDISDAAAVAVDWGQAYCVRKQDGTVLCWGNNWRGELGTLELASDVPPTELTPGTSWDGIELNYFTSCGLRDGGLYCWGANVMGKRGTGVDFGRVGSDDDWTHVSLGEDHACGLRGDGDLYCWGNAYELGLPETQTWLPRAIGAGSKWIDVSAGGVTCAIKEPGELYCWGKSLERALGTGDEDYLSEPTRVGSFDDWKHVSVGSGHTCAIRGDTGELYCWGDNGSGQLGINSTTKADTPQSLGSSGWLEVDASGHTCATRENGIWCWGNRAEGRIDGVSSLDNQLTPFEVAQGAWSSPSASSTHTCAVKEGQLYCWGDNYFGQLGLGVPASYRSYLPTRVGGSSGFSRVDGTYGHSCGIDAGALFCWGLNQWGQLGAEDFHDRVAPARVGTANDWETLDTRSYGSCAIRAGALYCWGDSTYGVNGLTRGLTPTAVISGNDLE
jgi:alpha-tubulin suppressor-like RCC1 family protein